MRKMLFISTVAALILGAATANSAPPKGYFAQEVGIAIREMQACIDEMRHEINNHESEIRTFEEKLANQELIIETLREQNTSLAKTNQDLTKSNLANLEMKIGSLDTAVKALVSDLRQLKSHANDSSGNISSCQLRIVNLEKNLETQNQHLEHFEAAMKSVLAVLEVKHDLTGSSESKDKVYRVQPGDNLEKIAKAHKTSIKAIKASNDLNSDRIIVGQSIKIP